MSDDLGAYEYGAGDDVDVADVQRDMEEEVEGTLMIMAFLFAPIIIGVLLAIFVCCRGYKPSQDPDVQIPMEAVSMETGGATSLGSSSIPDTTSNALHQSTENQQNFCKSTKFSELETVTCLKVTNNASGRSWSCSTRF